MKVWELIQTLQALPAGSEVLVDVIYDSGHGRMTVPLNGVVRQENQQGLDKALLCADQDGRR